MPDFQRMCQRTGFVYPANEVVREWTGLWVHWADMDYRHPQEFVKGRKDIQAVPGPSPEPTDTFLSTNEVTRESL